MAIGDLAAAQGMPIVPNTGEEGSIRYGAREINRTRDMIAQRSRTGIGPPPNTDGNDGDFYFEVLF